MSPGQWTAIRTVATAIATGLGAFATTHPQDTWIPGVIAGLAILGFHAINSVGQGQASTPEDFATAIVKAVEIIENPKAGTETPKL